MPPRVRNGKLHNFLTTVTQVWHWSPADEFCALLKVFNMKINFFLKRDFFILKLVLPLHL